MRLADNEARSAEDHPMSKDYLSTLLVEGRNELNHRRAREMQVFGWSSAILVALIGLLLFSTGTGPSFKETYGTPGKALVTALIAGIGCFSSLWQTRQRKQADIAKTAVTNIVVAMGAFGNESNNLYPTEWNPQTRRKDSAAKNRLLSNKVLATIGLSIVGVVGVWLPIA